METANIISSLQVQGQQRLLRPGSEEHNARNNTYLSSRESDIKPTAIFLPMSKKDVASFLQLVKGTDV